MTPVRVTRPPTGPRLYVAGRIRLHHGMTGLIAAAIGAAAHRPLVTLAGAVACWHDRHDFPWIAD